jgi:hypothetical protein
MAPWLTSALAACGNTRVGRVAADFARGQDASEAAISGRYGPSEQRRSTAKSGATRRAGVIWAAWSARSSVAGVAATHSVLVSRPMRPN